MTDRQAFLAQIIDQPDDDLLRLVFADWIDEHGEAERAEFIRLQIEHAQAAPHSFGWIERDLRINELLHEHGWRIRNLKGKQEFRRGFVEVVGATAEQLLSLPETTFDTTPVRELRIWNASNYLGEVVDLPWVRRAESLDLNNSNLGTNQRMHQFFSRAELPRLCTLGLRNNVLWAEDLEVFFRAWPESRQLHALDLSGNQLGDDGIRVLAAQPLPQLRTLTFRSDDLQFADCLHADGMIALAHSPGITGLQQLDLRGHHIGDSGLIELVSSANVAQLEWLDVGFNDIGETGDSAVEALLASPHLSALRVLRLNGNTLDRLWAEALVSWPRLDRLETVDLRRCRFGTGARSVLESSRWAEKFQLGND